MLLFLLLLSSVLVQCEEIVPFTVNIDSSILDDLKSRISNTRLPDQILGEEWKLGTDREYLKELTEYWKNKYDWKMQEKRINSFEHFKTKIEGLNIHFIHAKSSIKTAKPLIFIHGWPGSFLECFKIIPLLTDPLSYGGNESDAFHVVCPSLPGYGFSDIPTSLGWNLEKVGKVFAELMRRLGYNKYIAQGGDWGGFTSRSIALADPNHCEGIHVNFAMVQTERSFMGILRQLFSFIFEFTSEDRALIKDLFRVLYDDAGYMHLQVTRPQTVGYALHDSPVGLAAYIVEKFRSWSDCKGDIESRFTKDELLTNIMIYYVTGTITSSIRFYAENFGINSTLLYSGFYEKYVSTPTGFARFPVELLTFPRPMLERSFNLIHYSVMPKGGHFAALEEPKLLVDDIKAFLHKLNAHKASKSEL